MKKTILIIDNEPQDEEVEKLRRDAHNIGIEIECNQFNVGSTEDLSMLDHNGNIDIIKVINEFRNRFQNRTFSLVACDWDLNDDKIDGVELLRVFRKEKILRNVPKMLYSGLLEEKLREKLKNYQSNIISEDKLLSHLKLLINSELCGFHKREDYDKQIISFLKESEESTDLIVEDILTKFPNLHFIGSWERSSFSGKSFKEVAEIIQADTRLREEFKRELIEQCVAYLTDFTGYDSDCSSN